MIVSAIVAISNNRVIGQDNDIPWYLPADLKYFKRKTLNHHIIMGRKTFQSIGRPLPKRTNIILTRDLFFVASNCLIAYSLEQALDIAKNNGETEAFIIGGGEIYRAALPHLDKIYLTQVDINIEGSVTFPELPENDWQETWCEAHLPDEKNEHSYTFKIFTRSTK